MSRRKNKEARSSRPSWWKEAGVALVLGAVQAVGAILGRRIAYRVLKPR